MARRLGTTNHADEHRSTPRVDRVNDELLQLPGIEELTTLSDATLRWKRHHGEGPPMFRLGRRRVAWRSDVVAWIEEQRLEQVDAERGDPR